MISKSMIYLRKSNLRLTEKNSMMKRMMTLIWSWLRLRGKSLTSIRTKSRQKDVLVKKSLYLAMKMSVMEKVSVRKKMTKLRVKTKTMRRTMRKIKIEMITMMTKNSLLNPC